MLPDDKDIIRGLGFVALYSAWVEEAVDNLLRHMTPLEPFDEKKQGWPIRRKLKSATTLVSRLDSRELDRLQKVLESALPLFEKRNELVHGRIYVDQDNNDYLQSGRPNLSTRQIKSAELYRLANKFMECKGKLYGLNFFHLDQAIETFRNSAS